MASDIWTSSVISRPDSRIEPPLHPRCENGRASMVFGASDNGEGTCG